VAVCAAAPDADRAKTRNSGAMVFMREPPLYAQLPYYKRSPDEGDGNQPKAKVFLIPLQSPDHKELKERGYRFSSFFRISDRPLSSPGTGFERRRHFFMQRICVPAVVSHVHPGRISYDD
jgi:hypothetical protein